MFDSRLASPVHGLDRLLSVNGRIVGIQQLRHAPWEWRGELKDRADERSTSERELHSGTLPVDIGSSRYRGGVLLR